MIFRGKLGQFLFPLLSVRFLLGSGLTGCSSTGPSSGSGGTSGLSGGSVGSGGVSSAGAMSSGGSNPSGGAMSSGGLNSGGASAGGGSSGGSSSGGTSSGGASTGGSGTGGESAASGGGGSTDGPCPEGATLAPGDTTMTLMADGTERSFIVHVPPGYDREARVPVMFDFHGLSGNGNQQKNLSRWATVADENGFIAVFPNGLGNAWNAGLCCTDESDDVTFVRLIVDKLYEEACIDKKRIYASGCSNGGGMSYRLACEAADLMAGIAPVDFDCVVGSGCGDCEPEKSVSVVQFRGTNDSLVDYDGNGAFIGAHQNFELWGELNMCTGEPSALPDNSSCDVYSTCGAGAETILCTVQNGSHCGSYTSFNIAELAWSILQKHSVP